MNLLSLFGLQRKHTTFDRNLTLMDNRLPNWLDLGGNNLTEYIKLYSEIPELHTPIKRLANSFINGKIKLNKTNSDGDIISEITKSPILSLFDKPNFFQSRTEFMKMLYTYFKVAAFTIIYKQVPKSFDNNDLSVSKFYILPSDRITFKFKEVEIELYNTTDYSDVFEEIILTTYKGINIPCSYAKS